MERRRRHCAGCHRHPGPVGALAGFGLDSLVEIAASVVVVRELTARPTPAQEARALRLIAGAFFVLAAYVATQAAVVLLTSAHPRTSPLGIAWAALTCPVMLGLAAGKAATGRALDHAVLRTEARVTLVDAYLAAAVLGGLVLRAALGWWWADPVAGLVIVAYGVTEGRAAWRAGDPG